ncbi:MAG: hydrogenase nickel incorporation protein HypA/HybF [Acidobacteriota bacterium]|jgi:hydrogenase nickel incorporation protein HypA/HybF|nr:hydrogenase nickel incorporation protein HypA/HybF [Acidobacteriota bacterium]
MVNRKSKNRSTIYHSRFTIHDSRIMHELSIALSMIEMATEEAALRGGVQISAIHLKLGPLSGVVKEALLFSYEVACEGTPLESSRLVIEDVPVAVYCPTCEKETAPVSLQQFCCSVCDTPTPQVLRGKELEVVALEIQ